MAVSPAQWWSRLAVDSRDWLIQHNGEQMPAPIVAELERAAEELATDAWWAGTISPEGVDPSDDFVDWVEAVANGEQPPDPLT